jgi:hypothetical protein
MIMSNDFQRVQALGNQAFLTILEMVNYMNLVYYNSNLLVEPYKIHVVLTGIFTPTEPMFVKDKLTSVDADELLESFSNEMYRMSQNPEFPKSDSRILLTGRSMTTTSGRVRKEARIEGYATVGSIGNPKQSCALVRAPKTANLLKQALVAVHELGHILGIPHDLEKNSCPPRGYVMQAATSGHDPTLYDKFSECSKVAFANFVKSNYPTCLENVPSLCGYGFRLFYFDAEKKQQKNLQYISSRHESEINLW